MKLLSVIIPTKNRSNFLEKSVSCFSEFEEEIDLIVVDDESDEAYKVINQNIVSNTGKYIYNRNSKGAGEARNVGAALSKSEYLWFFDDDDIVEPQVIREVIDIICNNRTYDVFLLPMQITRGEEIIEVISPDIKKNNFTVYRQLGHQVNTSCTIIKNSTFQEVGKWDPELVSGQDTDLFLRLSLVSSYYCINTDPVIIQTAHDDRITSNLRKRQVGSFQFVKKNWRIMSFNNIIRYIKQYIKFSYLLIRNKKNINR